MKRAAAARAVVTEYLAKNYRGAGGRAGPNPPVRVQVGNFDFLELGSVRDRATDALAMDAGSRTIGIDVFTNRVEIAVYPDAVSRVAVILDRAAVPRAAVRIVAVANVSDESYDPADPTTFPPRIDVEPADVRR